MKPSQTFHRRDLSHPDRTGRPDQGRVVRGRNISALSPQLQARTASRAGVGLSMETAVQRVFMLAPAVAAHLEPLHARVRAVVREGLDDREAGTAMGAVRKRIEVAPIGRIEDFSQAVRAGGDVRQDQGGRLAYVLAPADFEPAIADGIEERELEALDEGAGRSFLFDPQNETIETAFTSFDFDRNPLRRIAHPTR